MKRPIALALATLLLCSVPLSAAEGPLEQQWAYAAAMKKVLTHSTGRPGVVIHVGDSITYANPYGAWARYGKGHSADDESVLNWMHANRNDNTDGWHLAAVDLPGGRSYTACGGIRADELLAGGKSGMPALKEILDRYQPQIVVLMLGTNDASAARAVNLYERDMETALDLMLDRGIIPILSTIPPHVHALDLSRNYNQSLRRIARQRSLPLIDFEAEILKRRPNDWDGTLLNKGDVHPTAAQGGADASSEPTEENLRNSGYLLRGWLSVEKIKEVKKAVFNNPPSTGPASPVGSGHEPAASVQGIRVPITRDTWFSNVGKEGDGNNGGAPQLKLKSNQEMSLVDIDPVTLRGHVIRRATLHLHLAGAEVLHRVTVGSFAADWVEGTGSGYAREPGSSTFNHQRDPATAWSYPGSDLTSVMLSQGGTIWHMAEAAPPDGQRWQTIAIDPSVVAARVAEVSHGFLLFDDTGAEWTRDGEHFKLRHMPNRFVHSRESGARTAPYLMVELGEADSQPPQAPVGIWSETAGLPDGEALVSWPTPADVGPAGTIGFQVECNGKPLPRYLIPAAGKVGDTVRMHLRDLGLQGGQPARLVIRAVDGAGNIGPAAEANIMTAQERDEPLAGNNPVPFATGGVPPKLGKAEVAVIDALDKVEPSTGRLIPAEPDGYLGGNHLWSAGENRVRLQGAKNEFVSFQILIRGEANDIQFNLSFDAQGEKPTATFSKFRYIPSKAGMMPDPLVPLGEGLSVPSARDAIPGQTVGAVLCELYIPHNATAGDKHGALTLCSGSNQLKLDLTLTVWNFSLPDTLGFLPEMNCYGLPDNERDYYRLAHRNRVFLNRVPYTQDGTESSGCAPAWNGKTLDFSRWDERFGPYFDGTAFADLPRAGAPIDVFYLPLNDNWPTPMEGNYNGSYWADEAFPASYRQAFVEPSREFAEHIQSKKWTATRFLCFFNGKNNFKERGWSRGSSPWLMDEPSNFQDFWALRWFGWAFHEGADPAAGDARLLFRADVSRPQWQRDALDAVLNYNVVGGEAFVRYHRLIMDRKRDFHQIVIPYGGTNDLHQSNLQPVGWSLDAWTQGADGVLPWQTIGDDQSWKRADSLSLFYPGQPAGQKDPIPSVRLKAYLRGQQDCEYLALLAKMEHQSQLQMGRRVRKVIGLGGVRRGTGFAGEDAGLMDYDWLRPADVWALRARVGALLNHSAP